jgi:hypothetical protein
MGLEDNNYANTRFPIVLDIDQSDDVWQIYLTARIYQNPAIGVTMNKGRGI